MPRLRPLLLALLLAPLTLTAEPRSEDDAPPLDRVATAGRSEDDAPRLDRDRVPAAGRSEVVATLPAFGRFAITATSEEGTAVQLIDRMAGPGPVHGTPGEVDGRLDAFLDRGEYKIVTRGHPRASGEARIAVHPFREMSGERPPRLVEYRPVEDTLHDLEQRSYWIHVPEDRTVILEAAGRSLADLRLWRDGRWLVDVAPASEVVHPLPGQPVGVYRLVARLPAGLYLLSAYGGPARAWSEETEATRRHPFHLRYGIPELPAIGRAHRQVSPFGSDRFRLPSGSNFVRIDLPEPTDAELHVVPFQEANPFGSGGRRQVIHKTSVMPVAEVQGQSAAAGNLVTVTADAGQPYVLQHFPSYSSGAHFRPPPGPGADRYWVSTVHAGHAADLSDATAVLVRPGAGRGAGRRPTERIAASFVEVGPGQPWSRRFDLRGQTTVHLEVARTGTYRFQADPGVSVRIEPLMIERPAPYEAPGFRSSGSEWSLGAGAHVLTLTPSSPERHGVVEVSLDITTAARRIWNRLWDDDAEEAETFDPGPSMAAAQWPDMRLDPDHRYAVHLASRPGARTGLVVRRLPIDPTEPLPIVQRPGETIAVPIQVAEAGILRARAEDGALLPIALGRAAPATEVQVAVGRHEVRIHHAGESTVLYSLGFEPARLSPRVPLPTLAQALLDERPIFPVLVPGEARHLDLGVRDQASFSVKADTPALYRLESTGLLDTAGRLRTRTNPQLDRQTGGGTGRNFGIQRYLREGDYQVTLFTRGRSAGRLGMRLSLTALVDGGVLRDGVAARADVPAGEGLLYRFTVTEAGPHRIESLGLGRSFRIRLEDADGWPVMQPGVDGDLTRVLEPGTYRLMVLPEAVASRRVTRVVRIPEPPAFTGHGPHVLPLDRRIAHLWREPADGEPRTPDVWTFDLPAPAMVRIDLGSRMEGRIYRGTDAVGEVRAVRGWHGPLSAGRHRIEIRSVRPDDRVDYHLAVRPEPLVDGLVREVRAPAMVPVAVGEAGLVDLSAFGRDDVRARLFDAEGALVVESDDRPGDWSFLVSRHLEAGDYGLQVDPVGAPSASTTVTMQMRRLRSGAAFRTPVQESLRPGDDVLVHALEVDGGGLLLVSASSQESVGVAVEASRGEGAWQTLATRVGRQVRIEMPLPGAGGEARAAGDTLVWRYRLRVWSADRGGNAVRVQAVTARPPPQTEADLARGVGLVHATGIDPPVAVGALSPERPGAVVIREPAGPMRWTDGVHTPARDVDGAIPRTGGGTLWLVRDIAAGPGEPAVSVRGERVRVPVDGHLAVSVPAGARAEVDVDPEPERTGLIRRRIVERGPVVIRATSRAGQPAAVVVDAGASPGTPGRRPAASSDLRAMAPGPSAAVAVSLSGVRRVVHVWDAGSGDFAGASGGESERERDGEREREGEREDERDGERGGDGDGDGDGERGGAATDAMRRPFDVRVSRVVLEATAPVPIEHGVHEDVVAPGSTAVFDLPGGRNRIRLGLDAASLAVLSDGDTVQSVHGGLGAAHAEDLVTSASRLTLMPVETDRQARFRVEILPAGTGDERVVARGRPFERRERTAGLLRLSVSGAAADGDAPSIVRVRGAVEEAILLGSDGRVIQGDAPVPPGGGILLVRHRPGRTFVWVDGPGEMGEGLIDASDARRAARSVQAPAATRLSGDHEVLVIASPDGAPALLHLRAEAPVAARITGPGLAARVDVHPEGLSEDVYLPGGRAEIALRPLDGAALFGRLSITTTPLLPAGEGLGPKVLLGPGEARAFSFTVDRAGPVGAGVQAEADRVEAQVLDAAGLPVSGRQSGFVVDMPRLDPGAYVLILRAAVDSAPLWARPALAGLDPPDTGPPEDVVQSYLSRADAL